MSRRYLRHVAFLLLVITGSGCGKNNSNPAPSQSVQQKSGNQAISPAQQIPAHPEKKLEITDQNSSILDQLGEYTDLEELSISCVEGLKALSDSIGKLTKLKVLNMNNGNGCAMNPVLPESIGNLHSLERLDLYGAQDITNAGPQPGERHEFPHGMSQLPRLVYLDLGRNGLEEIPSFVKDLPNLQEFRFEYSMHLKEIPRFLAEMPMLTTLRLNSDNLTDLPEFLNSAPKLRKIILGDNCEITVDKEVMEGLTKKFPKISLDFENEYDCPDN